MRKEPLKPEELHREHVGYDPAGGGWRLDLPEGMSVRMEGGTKELRQAAALRLAVCWNLMEGLPTERLLAGVVGDFYKKADELTALLAKGTPSYKRLKTVAKELRALDEAHGFDRIDCDCLAQQDREQADEEAQTEVSAQTTMF